MSMLCPKTLLLLANIFHLELGLSMAPSLQEPHKQDFQVQLRLGAGFRQLFLEKNNILEADANLRRRQHSNWKPNPLLTAKWHRMDSWYNQTGIADIAALDINLGSMEIQIFCPQ
jgi:hypothetical protein